MGKLGIICVDDEKVIIQSLESLCASEFDDYYFEYAQSAEEVYEILEEFEEESIELSLIISDYIMPEVKGDELLIDINNKYPSAKKIMLTGQSDLEAIGNMINKINLYRYISKPWEYSDLTLTISEAVKSYIHEKEIKAHTLMLEKKVKERTEDLNKSFDIINTQMKQLTENFRVIDENVMFLKMDFNGKLIAASTAYAKFLGYEKGELIGKQLSELNIINTYEKIEEIFAVAKENKLWKGELAVSDRESRLHWLETTVTSLKDNGELTGVNMIKHDITDKKIIEDLAVKDGMTNLYNRRFFNETFPKEINRALRDKQTISFLLMDVDKFKQYNDNYGHQAGDKVLKKIGDLLLSMCKRAGDFAIRLGGEEFGIIFSGAEKSQAIEYAERIRVKIEELGILHEYNPASDYLTVSMGLVSAVPNEKTSMDIMYNNADKALYEAKDKGRNNLVFMES